MSSTGRKINKRGMGYRPERLALRALETYGAHRQVCATRGSLPDNQEGRAEGQP